MRHNKLISVIVPVYNRREELKRCLLALQNQTYPYFEVLVIDDASSIPIKDIVDDLKDSRFKYLRNNKQGGPYNARTVGWKVCKGDYVVNIDSDWEPFPWMLERIIYYFNKFPEIDGVTGMHLRNHDSKMFVRVSNGYKIITPKEADCLPSSLGDCVGAAKHYVIDEFLKRSHNYFATESHIHTLAFFSKFTAVYVDEPWTKYYVDSPNRVTFLGQRKKARIVNDCLLFLKDYDEILRINSFAKIDEELMNRTVLLLRCGHWKGVRKGFQYIRMRKKKIIAFMTKELLKRLCRKARRAIFRKSNRDETIWI